MGSITPTHVLHNDMCEQYILHMLAPRALAHYKLFMMAAHRTVFFRCMLIFFAGEIYLDIKSSFLQSLSCLLNKYESCNLQTCIGAGTLTYMRAFLCVQPDTRFCMPLSIRSWKHAHPLWGHDNPSIWLFTDKCGSCFRVALKASSKIGQNALGNWRSVC